LRNSCATSDEQILFQQFQTFQPFAEIDPFQ
jgi:hypothetical protein